MKTYSPCRLTSPFFCLLLSCSTLHATETQSTVAFLPFTVNASQDMSYLRDGLGEMLASRWSAGTEGVAISGPIYVLTRDGSRLVGEEHRFSSGVESGV